MKILGLDTSTDLCAVGLLIDGTATVQDKIAPRQHTQLLLPMINEVLAQAQLQLNDLDALAFACGPGSFTGLRIAAGVTQGLAFSQQLPVVRISTLRSIAQQCYIDSQATNVLVAFDARMQELYWGQYQCDQQGIMHGSEQLAKAQDVNVAVTCQRIALGVGAESLAAPIIAQVSDTPIQANCYPSMPALLALAAYEFKQGAAVSAAEALPLYLRERVVSGG